MSLQATSNPGYKGQLISLCFSLPEDIASIMQLESENNQFVSEYSRDRHLALLTDENCMHLSVKRNDNGKLVGLVLLFGLQDKNRVLEFRRIAINEKGSGYGREAIGIIKNICFKELKFHRLWLDVFDDNARAIGLYESEGFKMEGLLRENVRSKNAYRSQRIYSILESEYNNT